MPLTTYYHPYVEFKQSFELGDREIVVESTCFQILLRNNTYNVKIAKAELSNFQLTFNLSQQQQLHVACGISLSVWSFNDTENIYEPILESLTATMIAATDTTNSSYNLSLLNNPSNLSNNRKFERDSSSNKLDVLYENSSDMISMSSSHSANTTNHTTVTPLTNTFITSSKKSESDTDTVNMKPASVSNQLSSSTSASSFVAVRYDIYCSPVDLNLPQQVLMALMRKLSLADVITSTSIHLPPYRIINELGVPVTCSVTVGGGSGSDETNTNIDYDFTDVDKDENNNLVKEIPIGSFIPIDRLQLAKAMQIAIDKKKSFYSSSMPTMNKRNNLGNQTQRQYNNKHNTNNNAMTAIDSEHRLDIIFTIDNHEFCSKESMPIGT
jgi:hypothetical protein